MRNDLGASDPSTALRGRPGGPRRSVAGSASVRVDLTTSYQGENPILVSMVRFCIFYLIQYAICGLHGQSILPDSVEATVIHFRILTPQDNERPPGVPSGNIEEFYYILSDPFVIVKEIIHGYPNAYRLFDLDSRILWTCKSDAGVIYRNLPEPYLIQNNGIIVARDQVRRIVGIPAFKCQVILDKGKDTLTTWQTESFGIDFSTIGNLPGVPVYYEKYWGNQKHKFLADAIDTVRLSNDFFNVVSMPVYPPSDYVNLGFLDYFDEGNAIRGKRLPVVSITSMQGKKLRVPAKDTPMLIGYLRVQDVQSGFDEIMLHALDKYKDTVACVLVCDRNITSIQSFLSIVQRHCPVVSDGDRLFDRIGINATAFFVTVDSYGLVNDIIFPQKKDWWQMLENSITNVAKK